MRSTRLPRYLLIVLLVALALAWSLAAASRGDDAYPQSALLARGSWLAENLDRRDLVIVDVRSGEHFAPPLVKGAVRLPWTNLRTVDRLDGVAGVFVGVERAEELLGKAGISPTNTVVLYDSVERDGGATASYVFWVLDLLGHERKMILEGGIDAFIRAGGPTAETAAPAQEVLYQAPALDPRARIAGRELAGRLGDPYTQIVDARSRGEYLGETPAKGFDGRVLKLGHVPGAYNVPYDAAWQNSEHKLLKDSPAMRRLYFGLDPNRAVVTYCQSARRGSWSYFQLRLLGFSDVRLFDGSWAEWGAKDKFYPVEQAENLMPEAPQGPSPAPSAGTAKSSGGGSSSSGNAASSDGYVSCGG